MLYSISPNFYYNFKKNTFFFLEFGIGISYASNKYILARNLGANVLFEDRIAVGFNPDRQKRFIISYSFIHFSNAYMRTPNHGLNLHFLNFAWKLYE